MANSKIKIAYIIDTFFSDTCGTEKQLIGLIERLNKDLIEPYLICLRESPWMKEHQLPCDVYILDYNGFLKLGFIGVIYRLLYLLKQKRFHIIQTFFEDSIFIGFLARILTTTKPILLSSRRDIGLGDMAPWYHRLYKIILPFISKRFDNIIANSQNVKEYVARREKIPLSKIKVIYNGIAMPEHSEAKPVIFNDVQVDLWIGIVANLRAVKRIDIFLRALAHLENICAEIKFKAIVIGEGVEREYLQKISKDLNLLPTVHFIGSVKNVAAYIRHIDIGVLCSDREGFSNAILEYMFCGLPVVATDVGGNPELVDDLNGFCVPPGDYVSIAKCLVKLAMSFELREKKGQKSLEKVRNNYSWDKIIKEWENYYISLLETTGIQN